MNQVKPFQEQNYIELILMYRTESLRDARKTYPINSNPAVPMIFRATFSAPTMPSSKPIWRLTWMRVVSQPLQATSVQSL